MAVITERSKENASVQIDSELCTVCGLCVKVCKGAPLYVDNDHISVDHSRIFGCIGCGQCVAVCPENAIHVEGRAISDTDFIELPHRENTASYDELYSLMLRRRSIRDFLDKDVEDEKIEKIINAASTSPMGIPPSDVEVVVIKGKTKVKEFSNDMKILLRKNRWLVKPIPMLMMRLFYGKETYESFNFFLKPLFGLLDDDRYKNKDWLLYDAPLALYFSTSPYSDPVDPYIPATYAMLAGESLGLGSCMIGSIAPFLMHSKELKEKYKIPKKYKSGIVVIIGYPKINFKKAIRRTFAKVNYY